MAEQLAVKDGIDQMLEQLDLVDVATPSGPTPNELGNDTAFIPLTALRASLRRALRD